MLQKTELYGGGIIEHVHGAPKGVAEASLVHNQLVTSGRQSHYKLKETKD